MIKYKFAPVILLFLILFQVPEGNQTKERSQMIARRNDTLEVEDGVLSTTEPKIMRNRLLGKIREDLPKMIMKRIH